MILLLALATSLGAGEVCAQEPATETQTPSPVAVAPVGKNQTQERIQVHRFWDRENAWLFAGVGAARTFDYFSTLNLRQREPVFRSGRRTCSIATAITNWNAGLQSCILDWRRRARCATTV